MKTAPSAPQHSLTYEGVRVVLHGLRKLQFEVPDSMTGAEFSKIYCRFREQYLRTLSKGPLSYDPYHPYYAVELGEDVPTTIFMKEGS